MEPSELDNSDIESLKAYLLALEGKPDDALAQLAEKNDPESLLRRLTILVDAKRFEEAAVIARSQPPHERWYDQAVVAFVAVGDEIEVQQIVKWAHSQKNPLIWPTCLVAIARQRFLTAVGGRPEPLVILPGELTPKEEENVRKAAEDVLPVVGAVKFQRRILTGVEASAVALAMEFAYILNDRKEAAALAELLWVRKPLPLNYAYAVLRKLIPPNPDLPSRLRNERSESFQSMLLAAQIEGTFLDKPHEAINAAELLVKEHPTPDHTKQVAHFLIQLADKLPSEERQAARDRAQAMLGPDTRYARLREIDELIQKDKFVDALSLLEQSSDSKDPSWLERMAAIRAAQGRNDDAIDLLIQATNLNPEVGLLRKTAVLARRHGRWKDAMSLMERLLRVTPDDVHGLTYLANLYAHSGQDEKAAEQYHRLRELEPGEVQYGLNEAIALIRANRVDEGLRIYEVLCESNPPPFEAVIKRATLLKAMNRAAEGFELLEKHQSAFWDNPDFLKTFIDLGYAAKQEREAHRGFLHLHQLQTEGKIPEVLHSVGVEELLKHIRQQSENEDKLNGEILHGRIPWLLADRMLSTPIVGSFRNRTRPLLWLSDDPVGRAKHTIYATNGFVVMDVGGRQWPEPLRACGPNQKVVIDLTSLMTLHRLDLLSFAAEYFGECLYPSAYRVSSLRDQERLVENQKSRPEAIRVLLTEIENGRLIVVEENCELPFVHEHRPENDFRTKHSYAFADLIAPLQSAQLLTDEKAKELRGLSLRPQGSDDKHPPLIKGTDIRIDQSSLETLQAHGLLGPITSAFRVHVSQSDVAQLRGSAKGWDERRTLYDWNIALWSKINTDPKFVATPHAIPPQYLKTREESEGKEREVDFWLPLFSSFVAEQHKLSLLVDDRVCQMFVHNTRRTADSAFGTDSLIGALLYNGGLTVDQAADKYLQLIGWRFRFVVVPTRVLLALAKRSLTNPPGQQLQKIARYVQDCMRDSGLFPGLEQTNPPIAMAQKLYLDWTTTVSDFIMSVWDDPDIPEDAALVLTEWGLLECLPSDPQNAGQNTRLMVDFQTRTLLSQVLIRSATCQSTERTNRALQSVVRILGIQDREYLEELANVVDAL